VRLLRYNTAMAGSSLAVGAAVTWLVVSGFGWGVLPANAVAVAVAALANYVASDRVLFKATRAGAGRTGAMTGVAGYAGEDDAQRTIERASACTPRRRSGRIPSQACPQRRPAAPSPLIPRVP
jgi:hypothetical protein